MTFKNNPSQDNFKDLMANGAFGGADKHQILEITRNWPDDPIQARSFRISSIRRSSGIIQQMIADTYAWCFRCCIWLPGCFWVFVS